MGKYSLGVDFGTLSVRAALFDVMDGSELGTTVVEYQHAVMDTVLPDGTLLPPEYAIQDVRDYWNALDQLIPSVMTKSRVDKRDVIAMGIDFTACTILPVKADGTPLSFLKEFVSIPHAWVKLWKHHASKKYAERITDIADKLEETWLLRMYGGKLSPEMMLCKALEIYEEAPEVYAAADYIIEACDYITWMITGRFHRSEAAAGICGCWRKGYGYPSKHFLNTLSPGFGDISESRFSGVHLPIGSAVGKLLPKYAERWGLSDKTTVAVALVDSQAAVPGAGIGEEGKMLATMGTSTVYMTLGKEPVYVKGMGACSQDSILPGFYAYSAGQSCVGDHFAWVVDNIVPRHYYDEAERLGLSIHGYLRSLAMKQQPGQHGLLALDWWNGNRCVLADMDLTGLILGFRLTTRAEDIYRALIEATAYGARRIIGAFKASGVQVNELYASGGIPMKDPMMMQIYADVLNMPIRVCGSSCGPMLGSAVLAALAAGKEQGGYSDLKCAVDTMGKVSDRVYYPIKHNTLVYDKLYCEFLKLHNYFGCHGNDVMKRLLDAKNSRQQERVFPG